MRASAASTSASVVARGVKTRPGAVRKSSPWNVVSVRIGSWRIGMLISGAKRRRYRDGEARLPDDGDADARQRQLTRMGNAAAGAGLSLLMQGNTEEAREWFDRACERYRESWADAPPGSWGRPIGILKARVLAGDSAGAERDARWTLEQGADDAPTPIGRYAAVLAHAVLGEWDRRCASTPTLSDGTTRFPRDVADALAAVASPDPIAYVEAVESVLESFETRDAYLEDLPAADTVLVLQALAERRGLAPASSSRRVRALPPNASILRGPSPLLTSRSPGDPAHGTGGSPAKTQRIATMMPTMMKKVTHIYSVEEGGWKKVVKINVSSDSSSAASSFALNSCSSSRAFSSGSRTVTCAPRKRPWSANFAKLRCTSSSIAAWRSPERPADVSSGATRIAFAAER